MNQKFFIFFLLVLCASCVSKQSEGVQEMSSNRKQRDRHILFHRNTPYASLFTSNSPVAVACDLQDFSNPSMPTMRQTILRNFGKNTISLDSLNQAKLVVNDSCYIKEDSIAQVNKFFLHRELNLQNSGNRKLVSSSSLSGGGTSTSQRDTVITIQSVEAIRITKPVFDECNKIPYCWYHDMEIEWNALPGNTNGVLVISWWSGTRLQVPGTEWTGQYCFPVWKMDIVDDTGSAVLNDQLFDGMPEWAIATILLVRANIVQVNIDGEAVVVEHDESTIQQDDIIEYINSYVYAGWDNTYQSYAFAHASFAKMTFVLVRDSYSM